MKKLCVVFSFIFLFSFFSFADEEVYTCVEHGKLEADELVILVFWEDEYFLCQRCVEELIENNAKTFGKILKRARR